MSLPLSGQISMDMIRNELGVPNQSPFALNEACSGTYGEINIYSTHKPPLTGQLSLSDWYGYNHTEAYPTPTVSPTPTPGGPTPTPTVTPTPTPPPTSTPTFPFYGWGRFAITSISNNPLYCTSDNNYNDYFAVDYLGSNVSLNNVTYIASIDYNTWGGNNTDISSQGYDLLNNTNQWYSQWFQYGSSNFSGQYVYVGKPYSATNIYIPGGGAEYAIFYMSPSDQYATRVSAVLYMPFIYNNYNYSTTKIESCYAHYNQTGGLTVYSNTSEPYSGEFYVGQYVYTDFNLTTPVPNGYLCNGNVVLTVSGGIITNYETSICPNQTDINAGNSIGQAFTGNRFTIYFAAGTSLGNGTTIYSNIQLTTVYNSKPYIGVGNQYVFSLNNSGVISGPIPYGLPNFDLGGGNTSNDAVSYVNSTVVYISSSNQPWFFYLYYDGITVGTQLFADFELTIPYTTYTYLADYAGYWVQLNSNGTVISTSW